MDDRPETPDQMDLMRTLWKMAMATPALYMIIGLAVGRWVFDARGKVGFWPMEAPAYRMVVLLTVAGVMALALATLWLTMSRPTPADATQAAYRRRIYATLVIGDATAFWGLVLYLIQGDAIAQGLLSLSAWAIYYIGRPAAAIKEDGDNR